MPSIDTLSSKLPNYRLNTTYQCHDYTYLMCALKGWALEAIHFYQPHQVLLRTIKITKVYLYQYTCLCNRTNEAHSIVFSSNVFHKHALGF